EMHNMGGAGEIEPGAAGLDREDEKRRALVFLKRLDEVAAFGDRRVAMKDEPWPPERRREQPLQGRNDLLELGEHQKLFLAARDGLADFPKALEFAAVVFVIGAVAQPLRRMIANLLEAHQQRQHQPPSRNPIARLLQA